ncbi:MAG: Xaa-Pro peptidase family protein [Nitrososphaeria archaeon]
MLQVTKLGVIMVEFGMLAVDYEKRVDFDRLRKDRLDKARDSMKKSGLEALVCFDDDNIRYVTSARIGDWARGKMLRWCVLPANDDPMLFEVGGRVAAQLEDHGAVWLKGRVRPSINWGRGAVPKEVNAAKKAAELIRSTLLDSGVPLDKVGFDVLDPYLLKALREVGISEINDGQTVLLDARKIKTKDEINLLKISASIADAAHYEVARNLRPGIRENEIVGIVARTLYSLGADRIEAINVISGPRTNPHHHDFSDRLIRPGDIVFVDIMSSYSGYLTCYYRTFVVGKATEEQRKIYQMAYQWLYDSIKILRPGITTKDIAEKWPGPEVLGYKSELEVLANQWGHGLGLSLWELPIISRAWSLEYPYRIEPGMVFALETYYGVKGEKQAARIEEEVVITDGGYEVITKFPVEDITETPIV